MKLFGGIEAGGTKFVCALGTGPGDLHDEVRYATTTPDESIARAVDFFREARREGADLAAVGIASFGPVDPDPASPTYGYVTSTPKPHWANTDVLRRVHRALEVPVGFDTDVNGAALGEHRWGAARDVDTFIYLTVGTGIGGGGMVNGRLLHGLAHPEMGHVYVPHDRERDPFAGWCPYHEDCLEGLAAGPAIEKRWGTSGEELPSDHPAWPLEAHYLALGLVNLILALSPQRIVMGGGVMKKSGLLPLVRQKVVELLNGYVQNPTITEEIENYIVPPGLGDRAGVLGAIALAQRAYNKENEEGQR